MPENNLSTIECDTLDPTHKSWVSKYILRCQESMQIAIESDNADADALIYIEYLKKEVGKYTGLLKEFASE